MSLVCFARTQVIIGTNDVICSMQYRHTIIYVVLYFGEDKLAQIHRPEAIL